MENEEFENFVKNLDEEEKCEKTFNEANQNVKEASTNKIPSNPPKESNVNTVGTKAAGAPKIIDLEKLSNNEKPLENSEVLLAIYEITGNSEHYDISKSNKSRAFWDSLVNVKSFEKILTAFKSETLRKYWRLLSEINNQKKVLETIQKNAPLINATSLKLLTIITVLKEYISGKIPNLDKALSELPDKSLPKPLGGRSRKAGQRYDDDDDDSFEVEEKPKKQLLNNKRKVKEETNDMQKAIEVVNNAIDPTTEVKNSSTRRSTRNKASSTLFSEEDKKIFSEIEIIVNTLKGVVPEASEHEVWESLKKNSFNVINSYLYLIEPEVYEGKVKSF